MDYSQASTQQGGNGELIPKGTLAWAWVTLRPFNMDAGVAETTSKTDEANAYLDLELTIMEGPYARRKLWDMIGVRGGEMYTQMGGAAIRHILEVGRGASPDNPAGYQIGSFFEIDQIRVAIEITVEKGKGGYEDKNRVRYLSQNPSSDTFKNYQRLAKGDTEPATSPAPAPAAPPATAAWGAAPATAPTPAATPPNPPPAPSGAAPDKPAWLP